MWIVPRLDNCESLEPLKVDFGGRGSFRETLHALSKHLMLEDGDGGHWKHLYPDATSCAAATVTGSDGPLCKHKIEWTNLERGK